MQNIRPALPLSGGIIAALVSANPAVSQPLNVAVEGFVLANTIPDSDLYFLSQFGGTFRGQPLSYTATTDEFGFTESMSGLYGGQSLSINYVATTAPRDPGFLQWTSTGTYGSQTWSGFGFATFEFPTATTLQISYNDGVTLGSDMGSDVSTINGADNSPTIFLSSSGHMNPSTQCANVEKTQRIVGGGLSRLLL